MLNKKSIKTISLVIDLENDLPLSTLNEVLNTKSTKYKKNVMARLDKKKIFLKLFNGRIGFECDEMPIVWCKFRTVWNSFIGPAMINACFEVVCVRKNALNWPWSVS